MDKDGEKGIAYVEANVLQDKWYVPGSASASYAEFSVSAIFFQKEDLAVF